MYGMVLGAILFVHMSAELNALNFLPSFVFFYSLQERQEQRSSKQSDYIIKHNIFEESAFYSFLLPFRS